MKRSRLALVAAWVLVVTVGVVAFAAPAAAAPVRILVAVGVSSGLPGERQLAHPSSDAAQVREVFTSLGWVAPDHALYLPDPSKAAFLAAIDRARALASAHAPREVTLVVYYSGHGDRDALHLRGETLPVAELSARIAQVPAALRITVVDACRTTAVVHAKGMTVRPGFAVDLSNASPTATGSVWIYASADGEAAQESDEIGGALFTHFWLAGLRGAADTNGDGRVTLDESVTYAYNQTLLYSARASGVLQRPEARVDVTEAGPLVLTETTSGARAQLEFPRDPDSLYLVYALGSQSVVAEVYGAADRAVRIALPRGRYVVEKRAAGAGAGVAAGGAAADVTLATGSVRALAASDFRPFSGEALAQKGGLVVRPWSAALEDGALLGTGVAIGDEAHVRVERRDASWAFGVGALGGYAVDATSANRVTEWSVGAEVVVDRLFALGATTLARVGVEARGEGIAQSVRRVDADRLALAGLPSTTRYTGTAWGGGAHAALRFSLGPSAWVEAGARALALGAKTDRGAEGRLLGGVFVAVGAPLF